MSDTMPVGGDALNGTYDAESGTGGPRGVMRFDDGESTHSANNGLDVARELLAPIKIKHPKISNSDLWSLAAVSPACLKHATLVTTVNIFLQR